MKTTTLSNPIQNNTTNEGGGGGDSCIPDPEILALTKRARIGAEKYGYSTDVRGRVSESDLIMEMGQIEVEYRNYCRITANNLDYVKRINKRITDFAKKNNKDPLTVTVNKPKPTPPKKTNPIKKKVEAVKQARTSGAVFNETPTSLTLSPEKDYTLYYVGGALVLATGIYYTTKKRKK